MFNDSETETSGFPSTWKESKPISNTGTQTKEISTSNFSQQSVVQKSQEVQTEVVPAKGIDGSYNEVSLLAFLQKVEPQLSKELKRSSASHAFDGYPPPEDDQAEAAHVAYTLEWNSTEFQIEDLSWNSSGWIMAAAYGISSHSSWCTHQGTVVTWRLNQNEEEASTPNQVMNAESCVSSLAFHPTEPSILAAGCHNGNIVVWDLSWSEHNVSMSSSGEHSSRVSQLTWVPSSATGSSHHKYLLASAGTDGKIFLWNVSLVSRTMKVVRKFAFLSSNIPDSVEEMSDVDSTDVGISRMCFSKETPSEFLVGTESGLLLMCSTLQEIPAGGNDELSGFHSPVMFNLSAHQGRVSFLSWKQHPDLIMTSAADGQVRVYNSSEVNPVRSFYLEKSTSAMNWSAASATVFAVGYSDGSIDVFNLRYNLESPEQSLPSHIDAPVSHLLFNHQDPRLLASCQKSQIFIWRLGTKLVSSSTHDHNLLTNLLNKPIK